MLAEGLASGGDRRATSDLAATGAVLEPLNTRVVQVALGAAAQRTGASSSSSSISLAGVPSADASWVRALTLSTSNGSSAGLTTTTVAARVLQGSLPRVRRALLAALDRLSGSAAARTGGGGGTGVGVGGAAGRLALPPSLAVRCSSGRASSAADAPGAAAPPAPSHSSHLAALLGAWADSHPVGGTSAERALLAGALEGPTLSAGNRASARLRSLADACAPGSAGAAELESRLVEEALGACREGRGAGWAAAASSMLGGGGGGRREGSLQGLDLDLDRQAVVAAAMLRMPMAAVATGAGARAALEVTHTWAVRAVAGAERAGGAVGAQAMGLSGVGGGSAGTPSASASSSPFVTSSASSSSSSSGASAPAYAQVAALGRALGAELLQSVSAWPAESGPPLGLELSRVLSAAAGGAAIGGAGAAGGAITERK